MIYKHKWTQNITIYLRNNRTMKDEPIEMTPDQDDREQNRNYKFLITTFREILMLFAFIK